MNLFSASCADPAGDCARLLLETRALADNGRHLFWPENLKADMNRFAISALLIGYQELNIGQWLKMLTKREYDLTMVGWARTAAGVQSLLSVYMLALWVLGFFGHPFE